jgi:hypothetical protein
MTETNQSRLNDTYSELEATLARLSIDQVRFVVARGEVSTDKDAAAMIGVSPATVKRWKMEGAPIDDVLRLMALDGVVTARHILRRNVAKAAAVKAAGLDDPDSKVRQAAASEILDRELGGAVQKVEAVIKVVGFDLSKL